MMRYNLELYLETENLLYLVGDGFEGHDLFFNLVEKQKFVFNISA